MAITDKKISTTYANRDVASLGDRPNEDGLTAAQLKARFDQLPKEVIPQYNALIDELNDTVLPGKSDVGHTHDDRYYIESEVDTLLGGKVDKVDGKSLISDTEITRLLGIETGAEVNNISDVNATDLTDGGDTNLHTHDSRYYTETEMNALLNAKQPALVSGTNIKTVNSNSLLGSGDVLLNATSIPNTPAGNISSITVQGAINELDTEKADKLFATNLVTNGDFSNGTTGWTGLSGTQFSVLNASANVLRATFNNTRVRFGSQLSQTINAGLNSYVRVSVRGSKSGNAIVQLLQNSIISGASLNQSIAITTSWQTISIQTATGISGNNSSYFGIDGTDFTSAGDWIEVKYVLVNNPTATFGAGKEPTKTEFETMLSTFQNSWFNGTAELVSIANLAQLKADKTQEAWITATLLAGATGTALYRKTNSGQLEIVLDVTIGTGTAGTTIFSLPTAYKVTKTTFYYVRNETTTGAAMMIINFNGNVIITSTVSTGHRLTGLWTVPFYNA